MFGDVTDLQQRHHPKKYPINYCREDQRLSTEGKIVSKYWRGGFHQSPLYHIGGMTLHVCPTVNKGSYCFQTQKQN